jgi:hypothetical protein
VAKDITLSDSFIAVAKSELQAGFVETDETRAWESHDEKVPRQGG